MSETVTDGLRYITLEFESDLAAVSISKVTSLANPALPPAAVIKVLDKSKPIVEDMIDLDNFEALHLLQRAIEMILKEP